MTLEIGKELADVIKEFVKILGPACIAAFVAYKTGKSQLQLKLTEIKENHGFTAREHLFNYYKEKQENIKKSIDELNGAIGKIFGITAVDPDEAHLIPSLGKLINYHFKIAPQAIRSTLRDYEKNDLKELEEYNILKLQLEKLKTISEAKDIDTLRENMLLLLEIFSYIYNCGLTLLEKETSSALEPYIQRPK